MNDTERMELQTAAALLQQGGLDQAEAICRRVLLRRPAEFHALHLLGIVALQRADLPNTVHWFRTAIAADPAQAPAHSNLAAALLALGEPQGALNHADRALELRPQFAEAWMNRANALAGLDRDQESLDSYDRAIALAPGLLQAHYGRGILLFKRHQYREALGSYDRVLQIDPDHMDALNNRGTVLLHLHRIEEALQTFERALQRSPGFADAHNNRGSALRRLRRPLEAMASYEQALRLNPGNAEVLANLANLMLELDRFDEAIGYCDRALALRPDYADALNIRATALRDLGRHEDAAASYARLIATAPGFDYAAGNCLFARANSCDWSGRDEQVAALVDAVRLGHRASLPFSFLSMSHSGSAQLQCARTFIQDRCPPAEPLWRSRRHRHGRIRLAYVSGDFRDHAVSSLLAGVWERHDPSRFETYAISLRPEHPGPLGRRVKRAFHRFVDVSGRSSPDVAGLMAELEIDIAVDLVGFTAGMRPDIFARRAAPIQVNHLGFPGTLGAPFMDYLIADEVVVPRGSQQHYAEKIVYMPDCFQPFDDGRPDVADIPTRAAAGLRDGDFVYCSFNNHYKINPALFDIWMRLLDRTPHSVLWLLAGAESVRGNLRREAQRRGVDPRRLVFAGHCAYPQHLARLPLADLFLDVLPFNAGATASDALSMGLPLLTPAGEAFAARMAASLLQALGLPELIARDVGDYEAKALRFAQYPEELRALRSRLGTRRRESPLFDTERFCRHLEAAYEAMWERWLRGDAPASFSAEDPGS